MFREWWQFLPRDSGLGKLVLQQEQSAPGNRLAGDACVRAQIPAAAAPCPHPQNKDGAEIGNGAAARLHRFLLSARSAVRFVHFGNFGGEIF